jgi:hypothetical protein
MHCGTDHAVSVKSYRTSTRSTCALLSRIRWATWYVLCMLQHQACNHICTFR